MNYSSKYYCYYYFSLNNINVLEKYLLNGSPTRQAIIISPNLLAALNETEMNFEQTTSQLKWAMQLSADALVFIISTR